MNKAFIRKLAAKLRRLRHEEHYNQSTYGRKTGCGTAACIAGHAVLLKDRRLPLEWGGEGFDVEKIRARARVLLGVSGAQAVRLFASSPDCACSESCGLTWPGEFARRWRQSSRRARLAKNRPSRVAADLLDAIADGKVRL